MRAATMRTIALSAALAALALPAAAEVATPPTDADKAMSEFAAAVDAAKALADQRWAFTLSYTDVEENPGKTYRVRFDPRLPSGERWSAIDPPEPELSKSERKSFAQMRKNDDADDVLVYSRLAENFSDSTLLSVSPGEAQFKVAVNNPKLSEEMRAALAATATLDRVAGYVSAIEFNSTRPFKPAAVAKIETMRQRQSYAPVGPGGAVLMAASQSDVTGSAMFKSFKSSVRISYSDHQAVDAPPRAKKQGR